MTRRCAPVATAASFPAAAEDYFHDMDGGIALTPQQIQGRNTWLVWSGGNDRFWDGMTATTFGGFDLLKIVSSHPGLKFDRNSRWSYLGLINEPCFDKPTGPDPDHFGLWLDKRRADCPPDPFADPKKYPGVKLGARGSTVPVGLLLRRADRRSSACACSPIRPSTRPQSRRGTPSGTTPTRNTTTTPSWSGRTASA